MKEEHKKDSTTDSIADLIETCKYNNCYYTVKCETRLETTFSSSRHIGVAQLQGSTVKKRKRRAKEQQRKMRMKKNVI